MTSESAGRSAAFSSGGGRRYGVDGPEIGLGMDIAARIVDRPGRIETFRAVVDVPHEGAVAFERRLVGVGDGQRFRRRVRRFVERAPGDDGRVVHIAGDDLKPLFEVAVARFREVQSSPQLGYSPQVR